MRTKRPLPVELEPVREAAKSALGPVSPATPETWAEKNFLFTAKPTNAGRALPAYYFVYFVLVDLLGFKNLGKFEKISWSIPIDFHGRAFLIEHRKFGVGVFAHDPETEEDAAKQIVIHIQKAVRAARPYFDWLAAQAVEASAVNVFNKSSSLFDRFKYFIDACRQKTQEAHDRKDERIIKEGKSQSGSKWSSISFPATVLKTESRWLALAAIEAFFCWTEHVFIHLGILSGALKTGEEVTKLAEADWSTKFKCALDLNDPLSKKLFDELVSVRRDLRNFVAHGAFGKQREAFEFHSGAGAVPVLLPHRVGSRKFMLGEYLTFDDDGALQIIDSFIQHLWAGTRAPAEIYIQQSQLPIILTLAADGTYARAMKSTEAMIEFVDHLSGQFDQAANMDW